MSDVRLTATNPVDSSVVPVACNEKGELKLEEPILVEGPQGEKGDKGDPGDPGADGDPFTGTFAGDVTFTGTQRVHGSVTFGAGNVSSAIDPGVHFYTETGQVRVISGNTQAYLDCYQAGSSVASISLGTDGSASFVSNTTRIEPYTYPIENGGYAKTSSVTSGYFRSVVPSDHGHASVDEDWTSFTAFNKSARRTASVYADGGAHFDQDVVVGSRNTQWLLVESGGLCHMVSAATMSHETTPRSQISDIPELRNIPRELTMVEEQLEKVMEKLRMIPQAGWEVWDGSSDDDNK